MLFYHMEVQFGIICFLNKFKENTKEKSIKVITYKDKIFSYIKNTSLVSISAQIMIFPIIVYSYNTLSLTFVLTNILTSYIIGLIIIFGFVLILISFPFLEIAKILGKIYKLLIDLLLFITENTAKIPFSKIYIKTPYIWEIALYYMLIFLTLYLYQKLRTRRFYKNLKKLIK